MKKKHIIFIFAVILLVVLSFKTNSYASDLDKITNYEITVNPRMNDGTLDITYKITWKVLDSTSEGPLEWVKIGTPNSNFGSPTALTNNIKSISQYDGSYVKIVFKKAYYEGETVTFKYSIHQGSMYNKNFNTCEFKFTPAWFTSARIDNMKIRWNNDQVKKHDSHSVEGKYLIWSKSDMSKGEKFTVKVEYDKSAFTTLSTSKLSTSSYWYYSENEDASRKIFYIIIIIFIIIYIVYVIFRPKSYYRHGGFYNDYSDNTYYNECVNSCACASSCASSCACACAGSGRAGCSKKDFYGIKINVNKLYK